MQDQRELFPPEPSGNRLLVTLNYYHGWMELLWVSGGTGEPIAQLRVCYAEYEELKWELQSGGAEEVDFSSVSRSSIRARLKRMRQRFPVAESKIKAGTVSILEGRHRNRRPRFKALQIPAGVEPWPWIEGQIWWMAQDLRSQFICSPLNGPDPVSVDIIAKLRRLEEEAAAEEAALQARIEAARQRMLEAQRQKQLSRQLRAAAQAKAPEPNVPAPAPPLPPVPVRLELPAPALQLQDGRLPLRDLRPYFLRERAALWWVSNQSDDLLCLPYCTLQRLEYQIRTALRVLGPLRGRALLSDEVGLGKTIEAGLVMKEYLTRGMVKRVLVLTVPSLVDQWEEELADKFHLPTATTNQPVFRSDPAAFWREHPAIIASLHTLKQSAHLAVAQQINWDLLVVDEAHYLRNRTSQAWQAVNALPRQYLLLLSATPVQNSLEELYNLVTLLQPGQLPSPQEFRNRFIDKKHPHQPREPEELRRLLNQVMIRNTRANAGIQLPPRRAETVLFEPEQAERQFWETWESELRAILSRLNPSQASLWGRLLLQSAGSSPAAWRLALKSFPDQAASRAWSAQAPLEQSWAKKCDLLLPLTKCEGGVVVFTQYLQTQAAVAERLEQAGVSTWVINGQTPAVDRQPITEHFRRDGGALILTHSGTEGRNLQFSQRLVNFDLPWNPMEIEQRIGRLHRIGQQHPVRIYNFVASHTLQEHLLQMLQEKLNLFELVVGETGLILGDRFSSDEFAEEIFHRWHTSEGRVAEALQSLGEELATARSDYAQVKQLDETLFAKDYESL